MVENDNICELVVDICKCLSVISHENHTTRYKGRKCESDFAFLFLQAIMRKGFRGER